MIDHHDTDYFHTNEDGTLSILVDAQDKHDVLHSFARHSIDVVAQEDAIFSGAGKVYSIEFTLRAKEDDILFALDSSTKFIRPFPKSYSRVR